MDIVNHRRRNEILSEGERFLKIPRKSNKKNKKNLSAGLPGNCNNCPKIGGGGETILLPPIFGTGGDCPLVPPPPPPPPPCSAACDLNYDLAGGCDGNHSHFSSLIVLFPITYKP